MQELLEKILAYLPQYLSDFGSLVSGPKRFIAQENPDAEDSFTKSLIFVGVTLALITVMTTPLRPPEKDLWNFLGATAALSLLAVSLIAADLRVAWRLVGGKATVRSFFITYAYFFGMMSVLFVFFVLLSNGVFKVFAPDLYARVIEAKLKKQPTPNPSGSSVPMVSFLILVVGNLLMFVWWLAAWGAFRELNGLSKWRSFAAMMIAGLLAWPIVAVLFFVRSAMLG